MRIAVGLSGGADSVALTRTLHARSAELGLVLHAAHLHHGLRAAEADQDQHFARELAQSLEIPFHTTKVDTTAEALANQADNKSSESIEEAARRLRYRWFRQIMASGQIDAVATAHTLDDQAETVLGKFLRGAWTEGLSGIHPVVHFPEGSILRPILAVSRLEVEAYLTNLNQPWREDASNLDPAFTRNRLRHQLLTDLEKWNPQIRQHLSNMAVLARDEESWWQAEIVRLASQLLLSGRPVRGGGRASAVGAESETIALDVVRTSALPPATQRRLLRYCASLLNTSLTFEATETLRQLLTEGRSGQQLSLPGPITAERTPRELRLSPSSVNNPSKSTTEQHILQIPGETTAFGFRFSAQSLEPAPPAIIRNWRAGDRVTLRYSSGPRKLKEVLDRLKITGSARTLCPVIEWQDQIVWMQGADLQPTAGLILTASPIQTQKE